MKHFDSAFARIFTPDLITKQFQWSRIEGELRISENDNKPLIALYQNRNMIYAVCISYSSTVSLITPDSVMLNSDIVVQFENQQIAQDFLDEIKRLAIQKEEVPVFQLQKYIGPSPILRQEKLPVNTVLTTLAHWQNYDASQVYTSLIYIQSFLDNQLLSSAMMRFVISKLLQIVTIQQSMLQIRAIKILMIISQSSHRDFKDQFFTSQGIEPLTQAIKLSFKIVKSSGKFLLNQELISHLLEFLIYLTQEDENLQIKDQNLKTSNFVQSTIMYNNLEQLQKLQFSLQELVYYLCKGGHCTTITEGSVTLNSYPQNSHLLALVVRLLGNLKFCVKNAEHSKLVTIAAIQQMEIEIISYLRAKALHNELAHLVHSNYLSALTSCLQVVGQILSSYCQAPQSHASQFVSQLFGATPIVPQLLRIVDLLLRSDFLQTNFLKGYTINKCDEQAICVLLHGVCTQAVQDMRGLSELLQANHTQVKGKDAIFQQIVLIAVNLSWEDVDSDITTLLLSALPKVELFTILTQQFGRALLGCIERLQSQGPDASDTRLTLYCLQLLCQYARQRQNDGIFDELSACKTVAVLAAKFPQKQQLQDLLAEISRAARGTAQQLEIAPLMLQSGKCDNQQLIGVQKYLQQLQWPVSAEIGAQLGTYIQYVAALVMTQGREDLASHFQTVLQLIPTAGLQDFLREAELLGLLSCGLSDSTNRLLVGAFIEKIQFHTSRLPFLKYLYEDARAHGAESANQLLTLGKTTPEIRQLVDYLLAGYLYNLFNKQVIILLKGQNIDALSTTFSISAIKDENFLPSEYCMLLDLRSVLSYLQSDIMPDEIALLQQVLRNFSDRIDVSWISAQFVQQYHNNMMDKEQDFQAFKLALLLERLLHNFISQQDCAKLLKQVLHQKDLNHQMVNDVLQLIIAKNTTQIAVLRLLIGNVGKIDSDCCSAAQLIIQRFSAKDLSSELLSNEGNLSAFLQSSFAPSFKIDVFDAIITYVFQQPQQQDISSVEISKIQLKTAIIFALTDDQLFLFMTNSFKNEIEKFFEYLLPAITQLLIYKEMAQVIQKLQGQKQILHQAEITLMYCLNSAPDILAQAFQDVREENQNVRKLQVQKFESISRVIQSIIHFLNKVLMLKQLLGTSEQFCGNVFLRFIVQLHYQSYLQQNEELQIDITNLLLTIVQISEVTKKSYIEFALNEQSELVLENLSQTELPYTYVMHCFEIFNQLIQSQSCKQLAECQNFIFALMKSLLVLKNDKYQELSMQLLYCIIDKTTAEKLILSKHMSQVILKSMIQYLQLNKLQSTSNIICKVLKKLLQNFNQVVRETVLEYGKEIYTLLQQLGSKEAFEVMKLME